jgi:hypothetical protein
MNFRMPSKYAFSVSARKFMRSAALAGVSVSANRAMLEPSSDSSFRSPSRPPGASETSSISTAVLSPPRENERRALSSLAATTKPARNIFHWLLSLAPWARPRVFHGSWAWLSE